MWLSSILTIIKDYFHKTFRKKKKNNFYWQGVEIPLIRQTFSSLISNELISVQPMSTPSGSVYSWGYKTYNENAATRVVLVEKFQKPEPIFLSAGVYTTELDVSYITIDFETDLLNLSI